MTSPSKAGPRSKNVKSWLTIRADGDCVMVSGREYKRDNMFGQEAHLWLSVREAAWFMKQLRAALEEVLGTGPENIDAD